MSSKSTLGFQFRLTNVSGTTFKVRTRQNVKKNIANILYLESPPSDAVKLAYVGSKEITPKNNLYIGDRSDQLYENAKVGTATEFIGPYSSGMTVENESIAVTQEFVLTDAGEFPLYFRHTLPLTIIPESIRILNKDFEPVNDEKYKLVLELEWDEDTGAPKTDTSGNSIPSTYYLFNSLENTFDRTTGNYEVYFVQYTTSSSGIETTTTEIINNEYAYTAATYDDFWYVTNSLKPWSRSYLINNFTLTMPTGGTVAIKYLEQKLLSVKDPIDYDDESPWFPRVINDTFTHGFGPYTLTYSVPEFENQAFNPLEPYKLATRKKALKITDRLLKLTHESISIGSTFSELYITFEKNGTVEHAITTDSSYNNVDYRDFDSNRVYDSDGDAIKWSTSDLLSYDKFSGIIHVNFDISDYYDIYGTYSYKEEYYTLSNLPMNPAFDSTLASETRSVYVVPTSIPNGNLGIQTASLQVIDISSSGRITSVTQDGSDYNENLDTDVSLATTDGYKVNGVLGMHYSWRATTTARASSYIEIIPNSSIGVYSTEGFPKQGWLRAKDTSGYYRYFKYVDKKSTTFTLAGSSFVPTSTVNINDGETISLVNFIDERTVSSNRSYSTELSTYGGATGTYPSLFSQYFVLAELSISPPHSKDASTIIDVRQDGGGISEEDYPSAKALNPEVQWLSDFGSFDGQVRPGNAVAVVKLPVSIKDSLSLDQIKEVVNESIPFGVYPLIRFYGYQPRVYSVIPSPSKVTITWEKEGPEFTYNIWYATQENGPWVQANDYRITDGIGPKNVFTITGLDPNKTYIVKITMEDKYYYWWYGYNGPNSISGGLGLTTNKPIPPFGNHTSFQFELEHGEEICLISDQRDGNAAPMATAGKWYTRMVNTEIYNGISSYISLLEWSVLAANKTTNKFEIAGNQTTYFPVGHRFDVRESIGNDSDDNPYVVTNSYWNPITNRTELTVSNVPTNYAGGKIHNGMFKFLASGVFRFQGSVDHYKIGNSKVRLANINGFTYKDGYVDSFGSVYTFSLVTGYSNPASVDDDPVTDKFDKQITVSANDIWELQHYCGAANSNTDAMGSPPTGWTTWNHAVLDVTLISLS